MCAGEEGGGMRLPMDGWIVAMCLLWPVFALGVIAGYATKRIPR
jgi:hypothetical protein